jgi:hypothetical protein
MLKPAPTQPAPAGLPAPPTGGGGGGARMKPEASPAPRRFFSGPSGREAQGGGGRGGRGGSTSEGQGRWLVRRAADTASTSSPAAPSSPFLKDTAPMSAPPVASSFSSPAAAASSSPAAASAADASSSSSPAGASSRPSGTVYVTAAQALIIKSNRTGDFNSKCARALTFENPNSRAPCYDRAGEWQGPGKGCGGEDGFRIAATGRTA